MQFIKTALFANLVLLTRFATAQVFHGQIGDNLTFKPLPEATITVKDKPISCDVEPNGNFQVDLSTVSDSDILIISCPGYKSKILLRKEIIEAWYDIKLSPDNTLGLSRIGEKLLINSDLYRSVEYLMDARRKKTGNLPD